MSLSSFKRRWIERWCEEVYKYLLEGSMCSNVIGYPSEETGGIAIQGVLKSTLPLRSDSIKLLQKSQENIDNGSKLEPEVLEETLPLVKFSYSHFQDQRRKVERLVHGLPVLSSSTTQLDKPQRDDSMPFVVIHNEDTFKTRRDDFDKGKVTSAPQSLTAQRLAQELKRKSREIPNGGIRVNIMDTEPMNRIKTAPSYNKSNVNKARKLLSKRHSSSRRFDAAHYSPLENCWTMTEVTWT